MYNLYFDISAICMTAVILIAAHVSDWIPTYQNKSFHHLVTGVFLTALMDLLTCGLENYQVLHTYSWYLTARYVFDSGYHFFHVLTGLFFLRFTMSLINLRASSFLKRIALYGPWLAVVILLIINLKYPMVFSYENGISYQRGPYIAVIYAAGMYYYAAFTAVLLKYRHTLKKNAAAGMICYGAFSLFGVLFQTVKSEFMVGEFFNSLALIFIYINVETADDIKDERYDILIRSNYLQQILSSTAAGNPTVSIFVRVIDSHEITSGIGERGHIELMKQVVQFLKKFKKEVWISVWNDNCFVLHQTHPDEKRAEAIMEEIEERFEREWISGDYTQMLGVSEWIIRTPQDATSSGELARKAEALCDIELNRSRGIFRLSDIDFSALEHRKRMMESAGEAIRKRTAEVRYEPVFGVRKQAVVSARAQIFFPDEDGNMISGLEFADPSGDAEINMTFDEYALNDAATHKELLMKNSTLEEVSTRLSPASIHNLAYLQRMRRICERHRADNRQMMLRITSGTLSRLNEKEMEAINELRDNGWMLAIDDFGSGQSLLSRLSDQSIPILIMHREVTQSILADEAGRRFGEGFFGTIHAINKTVTLTGIRDEAQAELAVQMGADFLCGPYLAEPMAPLRFREWMKAREDHDVQ
ncbi:MAG: EAL domain-containing protein [Solobacterium sp.]|nr:EAL domain-containing protein [Solobacterium sp.]